MVRPLTVVLTLVVALALSALFPLSLQAQIDNSWKVGEVTKFETGIVLYFTSAAADRRIGDRQTFDRWGDELEEQIEDRLRRNDLPIWEYMQDTDFSTKALVNLITTVFIDSGGQWVGVLEYDLGREGVIDGREALWYAQSRAAQIFSGATAEELKLKIEAEADELMDALALDWHRYRRAGG